MTPDESFEKWWVGQIRGYDAQPALGAKLTAKHAYLATAQRCVEILSWQSCGCAQAIKQEFGL